MASLVSPLAGADRRAAADGGGGLLAQLPPAPPPPPPPAPKKGAGSSDEESSEDERETVPEMLTLVRAGRAHAAPVMPPSSAAWAEGAGGSGGSPTAARTTMRRQSELGMQNFIQLQLAVILQPLLERVDQLDVRSRSTEETMHEFKRGMALTQGVINEHAQSLLEFRGRINGVDGRCQVLKECLDNTDKTVEGLKQDIGRAIEDLDVTRRRLASDSADVPVMRRQIEDLRLAVDAAEGEVRARAGALEQDVKRHVQEMQNGLTAVHVNQQATAAQVGRVQERLQVMDDFVQESRAAADRQKAGLGALQRRLDEVLAREGQLGGQLNAWKDQWSKLHPHIEAAHRDIGQLKRRCDHFDAAIHGANQAAQAHSNGLDVLHGYSEKLRTDILALHAELVTTGRGLAKARDGLQDVTKLTDRMHTEMQESERLLRKQGDSVQTLERTHAVALQELAQATSAVQDLRLDQRKTHSSLVNVHKELDATKDALSSSRKEITNAVNTVDTMKAEITKVRQAMSRLDHGVEFCHAGLTGLQKGLSATSAHMQNRSSFMLPNIAASPRPGTALER